MIVKLFLEDKGFGLIAEVFAVALERAGLNCLRCRHPKGVALSNLRFTATIYFSAWKSSAIGDKAEAGLLARGEPRKPRSLAGRQPRRAWRRR